MNLEQSDRRYQAVLKAKQKSILEATVTAVQLEQYLTSNKEYIDEKTYDSAISAIAQFKKDDDRQDVIQTAHAVVI